jgi:hypothetical protein
MICPTPRERDALAAEFVALSFRYARLGAEAYLDTLGLNHAMLRDDERERLDEMIVSEMRRVIPRALGDAEIGEGGHMLYTLELAIAGDEAARTWAREPRTA